MWLIKKISSFDLSAGGDFGHAVALTSLLLV